MITELNRIGNVPKPLPTINLYLSHPQLMMKQRDIDFKLVIDFKEFLRKYNYYTFGIKRYSLDKAERYLESMTPFFVGCKSKGDISDAMYSYLKNAEDLSAMISKWVDTFGRIFREKITSNVCDGGVYEFEMKTEKETLKGHPFIIALYANLIPIINTSFSGTDRGTISRNYVGDILNKVAKWQTRMKQLGKI